MATDHEAFWDDEDELLGDAFSVHPGTILKMQVLPNLGVRIAQLADAIGAARPGFNNMINGKRALTPEVALKIEKAIGYPASLLNRLQADYSLAVARRETNVEAVRELAAA